MASGPRPEMSAARGRTLVRLAKLSDSNHRLPSKRESRALPIGSGIPGECEFDGASRSREVVLDSSVAIWWRGCWRPAGRSASSMIFSTGCEQNLAGVMDQIEFTRGDIRDADTLDRIMNGVELVFHQAAMASVPRSVAMPLLTNSINIDGTLLLLETARQSGVRRVVYAASSSAYGETEVLPKVETLPATPAVSLRVAEVHW